ncbi:MAG: DUF302 domain-containing protein [Gammaproteobacteria bacterium]|nr:DUF302 domain-containing protein [Gammaproteobacteria bacterium]MCP5136402.1 DUF302 domain-containing protein [Gammaproteobacteria bacterium]
MKYLIIALLTVFGPVPVQANEPVDLGHVVVYSGETSFADAKENLKFAVTNLGMVISDELHLSEMLDRTGKDLGLTKRVYAQAETIAWCSASLSRKMVEAASTSLVFCPFAVSLYEREGEPGKVYAAFRKPWLGEAGDEARAVMEEVEAMYHEVAAAAVE